MGRIILDAGIRAKLGDLHTGLEFCDESGQVLGYFTPAAAAPDYCGIVSETELDRREKQGGGRPLDEILADLERRS